MQRIQLASVLPVLVLLSILGCAETTVDDTSSSGSGVSSPFASYRYRRNIKISGAIPPGYSLSFVLEHGKLVKDGKAKKDGSDVRVVFDKEGALTDLHRVVDPTTPWAEQKAILWFRTAAQAGGAYYLYYGNDKPEPALQDATKVYDLWEDFEGVVNDASWQPIAKLGKADGKFEIKKGVLRLSGQSKDFGDVADDGVFFYRTISGDFAADAAIAAAGGSLGGASKIGGLMVRQSGFAMDGVTLAADASFAMVSIQELPPQRVAVARAAKGMPATSTALPMTCAMMPTQTCFPQLVQVTRLATQVSTSYSDDGVNWVSIGAPASLPELQDPILVGIPFANISSDFGYAEIAWLRITKRVTPPPSVQLGAE